MLSPCFLPAGQRLPWVLTLGTLTHLDMASGLLGEDGVQEELGIKSQQYGAFEEGHTVPTGTECETGITGCWPGGRGAIPDEQKTTMKGAPGTWPMQVTFSIHHGNSWIEKTH